MNTNRPHEIAQFSPQESSRVAFARKWLPISPEEAAGLEPMTEDQRAEWFRKLRMEERLRRLSLAEASATEK